jgi:glycosyltransferase involved in cell wall biosynthesis
MSRTDGVGQIYQTAPRQRKTILYFYHDCGFPDWQLRKNFYEYRIIEVLCRNYEVVVAIFTRSWSRRPNRDIIPKDARFLLLSELPTPKFLPRTLGWTLQTVTRIIRIALLVHNTRPDLVYANWIDRSEGFCCGRAGVHPLVVAAWGGDINIETSRSSILRFFAKLTVRSADAVVVDSQWHRKGVLKLGCSPSKIHCFPWGIDIERFRPQDSSPTRQELGWTNMRIVISTRWHEVLYGVECLIRAIPRILQSVKDARFLIAGDGALLDYHKSLVRQLGVQDMVRFIGYVDNRQLPKFLNAADVYASMSFDDGSSSSLMEALACGLPVVVSDIVGNREWVNDGKNGFLVPRGDAPALARRIVELLEDPELRLRMRFANLSLSRARADWKTNSLVLESCIAHLVDSGNQEISRPSRSSSRN